MKEQLAEQSVPAVQLTLNNTHFTWAGPLKTHGSFFFFLIFFNVYSFLRDRERQKVSGEGAGREGDTESEAGSRL